MTPALFAEVVAIAAPDLVPRMVDLDGGRFDDGESFAEFYAGRVLRGLRALGARRVAANEVAPPAVVAAPALAVVPATQKRQKKKAQRAPWRPKARPSPLARAAALQGLRATGRVMKVTP